MSPNGLKQDLQNAFMRDESYTLTSMEVEVAYLALARLAELEREQTAKEQAD